LNIFTKINNPITIPKYVTLLINKINNKLHDKFKNILKNKYKETYNLNAEKKDSPDSSSSSMVEVILVKKFNSK
jgi:hypothetical protein